MTKNYDTYKNKYKKGDTIFIFDIFEKNKKICGFFAKFHCDPCVLDIKTKYYYYIPEYKIINFKKIILSEKNIFIIREKIFRLL